MSYSDMIAMVKRAICPLVRSCYPRKANHGRLSFYDLVAFGVMAHIAFDGVYKNAYGSS